MRLVTWNCGRGLFTPKVDFIASLAADIAVLQEIAQPENPSTPTCCWFGENPQQGVAIIAAPPYTVEPVPQHPDAPRFVYPVSVHGPVSFHLLAVWSQPEPTYVQAVWRGLDCYDTFLREKPAVVIGDFNSNARWDSDNRVVSHTKLVMRLTDDFGLRSSYHQHLGVAHGAELHHTLYWRWQEGQPFHLDYCFAPAAWAIQCVTVGSYADWKGKSDHRPLTIDFASTTSV